MSFFLFFHILLLLPQCSFSIRPDLDNTGLNAAANPYTGGACTGGTLDTTNIVYCPDNTWAYGFRVTTSSTQNLYGVLNIGLDCRNQTYDSATSSWTSQSSQTVQYTNMGYMGSLSLSNTAYSYCGGDSGRDFIRKANLQEWCPTSNAWHPTALCGFKMHCSYNNDITTSFVTNQTTASWTGWSKCNAGFVVCGYQFKYLNTYQSGSFYGAIDFNLQCCRICDMQQGFYLTNAKLCDFCDSNCKQCWGTSTNCTKCLDGYTLTATNTCTIAVTTSTPVYEYFNNQNAFLSATWSTNSANALNNVCGQYYLVGGYNGLANSHYLQKSISGLASHSLVMIRFHFFKIGTWGSNGFGLVDVNSVRTLEMTWATLETSIYYVDNCGNSNYLQNVQQAYILLSSSASSLTVKIYTNDTGSGWWGIRGFVVTIYNCDASCNTCVGMLSTQCSSCASGKYLTSSTTCVTTCTSPQFGDPTTNTCVSSCPTNYYKDTATQTCVTTCSDNYYKHTVDYTCYSTCPSGYYGNPLTGFCVASCPAGYYGSGGLCLLCDFNCATCSTSSTTCNTCQYTWLGATPGCTNPSYASKIENTLWNSATMTTTDVTGASWTVSGAAGSYITTCGSYTLVGGNGFFGTGATMSRSYSSLSPHLYARITFYVMKEGNWNNNIFKVIVDTVTQTTITFSSTTDTSAYKLCGPSGYTDALRRVDVYFSHSATTMSVSITSDLTLAASQASWGIYAYTMTIFICDSSCLTCNAVNDATQCMSCPSGTFLQATTGPAKCLTTCPTHTYQDTGTNICKTCDATCTECISPGASNYCTSCSGTLYLQVPSGRAQCLSSCPNHYYKDTTNHVCQTCDGSCNACQSPGGSTSCMSCSAGSYLQSATGPAQCLSTCPNGKYQDSTNHICGTCDATCTTCQSPGTSSSCLSCGAGLYLQSATGPAQCLNTCPTNTYQDSTNHLCGTCDATCATCQSPGSSSSCLSCSAGSFLQSATGPAQCLATCPSNTYQDTTNHICKTCDSSCSTCQSPGTASDCLSCPSSYFLQTSTGPAQCLTTCPSNTYKDGTNHVCQSCDTSCATCQSPGTASFCLSCSTGYFLQTPTGPAQCLATCPSNTYQDTTNHVCQSCDSTCATCQSPGTAAYCMSCATGYALQAATGPSTCSNNCPSHSYQDASNVCQTCDSTCKNCNSPGTASSCISCDTGRYLQALTGPEQCLTTCPSHTYPDAATNICQTCDASCTNCNSPGTSSDCTSCPSGSFLQTATGPAQCLATCPSNTYQDTVNHICQTCDNSCSTCQSPGDSSSCLSCPAGSYLQSSPGPAQCLGTCVAGKYPDSTNHICGSCDTSCVTCQSPGTSSYCMSCPAGTFLQAATGPKQCLNTCPSGTYQDTVNHICQTCDNSCSTCQSPGDSSSCMSCPSGSFLQSTTGPSQCLTTCPTNRYKDAINNLCKLCDSSCASCQSPGTSATCLTCSTGFYLQSLIGPALCLNTCPTHTYPNAGTLICQTCDASCNACQSPGTTSSCMSCSSGSYLQSTSGPAQCLATCPSHTYPDSSTNTCQTCDASCTNCQSPGTSSSCMSCPSGLFLQSLTGPAQCLNSCPTSHTYADSGTNICETCYSSCNNCQSPGTSTSCTSCASGYFLQSTVTPNQCLTTCPSHTYKDTTNRICQTCDTSCSNCQSPGTSNDCTSCPSGTFLQSTAPSQCLNTCPSHTFKDNVNNICQTCDPSCLECQSPGTANDCSSCPAGYTLASTAPCPCNSPCTSSQYLDASSVCQNCDTSCKTCNGPTANACTSCNTNTYLYNSQCLSTCPTGYYPDSTTNTCNSCDPSCASCSIAGSTNCLTCASGFFLQALTAPSSCLNTCPIGTYQYNLNSTCLTCNSECVTCVGPNNNDCLTCISSKALNGTAPNICVSACADGYYFDATISSCSACDSPCKTCSGAGTQNCYSCTSKYYLQSQSGPAACNSTCNSGFYPDNTTFTCQVCYYTCLNCTTGTKNGCISCKNGYYLYGSTCVTQCPSGYYGDASTNVCLPCDSSCKECVNSDILSCLSCNSNYYFVKSSNTSSLTGACLKIKSITPILNTTSNPLVFELSFPSSNYSTIYSLYKSRSSISIQNLQNSAFNFTISLDKSKDIFIITIFDLSVTIKNSPKLTLNLNPTSSFLSQYPNMTLTTYTVEVGMNYYYFIDASTQSVINSTAQATNTINSIISDSFIANSAISAGSAAFFNCMISMDMIRLLRFLEIDYPTNVLVIFQANLPTADIIPNINIDEDSRDGTLPKIFLDYGVSIYIFNNNGNNLIEAVSYWCVGLYVLLLVKRFRNTHNKYFKVILIILTIIFIWNYTVSYFLSNYLSFSFYTFVCYQFPSTATLKGKMNLLYSFFVGVFVLVIFPFILIKIQRMRPKIFPQSSVLTHKDSVEERNHFKFSPAQALEKSDDKSPSKDEKFLMENLDTPGILSPGPKDINPFDSTKIESSPTKTKRMSKLLNKMRMSVSNMMKNSDTPFENKKTMVKSSKTGISDSSRKNFVALNPGTPRDSIEHIKKTQDNVDMNRYGAFHKDFNQSNYWQSYFILLSLLHQLIFSLIIAVTYHNPYDGLIIQMIFQVAFIISLFVIKPFKARKELFQNFLNEFCALVAVACAWWMAYNEKNGIVDEKLKINIGWGIVFANLLLIVFFILRMIIAWIIIICKLTKKCCKSIIKKFKKKNQVHDEGWGDDDDNQDDGKGILDNIIEMENFLR